MSDGRVLQGQEYNKETDITVPFTQRMHDNESANALVGQARTDINPVDMNASLVRVYGTAALTGVFLRFPGTASFSLPNELTSITATYNTLSGQGEDIRDIGGFRSQGTSGGFSMNPTSRAQASASTQVDLLLTIRQYWTQNVPAEHVVFFVDGNASQAEILTGLESALTSAVSLILSGFVTTTTPHGMVVNQPFKFLTLVGASGGVVVGTTYYVKAVVNSTNFSYSASPGTAVLSGHNATSGTLVPIVSTMPTFKPEAHTFSCKGQQVSLSQNAETVHQYRWTEETTNYVIAPLGGSISSGYSREVGTTIRTKEIGPTIHGALTITEAFQDAYASTSVRANTPQTTGYNGAPSFAAVINAPAPQVYAVRSSVTPSSLAATTPATIPTSGLYIVDMSGSPGSYGTTRIHAVLVNFSIFA